MPLSSGLSVDNKSKINNLLSKFILFVVFPQSGESPQQNAGSRARLFIENRQKLNSFMMASSETRDTIESRGNVDVTTIENEFKKDNSRVKSNFTRSRNRLLMLREGHDLPSRLDVNEA